jgi:hypothetical protein
LFSSNHAPAQGRQTYRRPAGAVQLITRAQSTIIIIQDADCEYDPKEYELLVGPILRNEADVVFGSRLWAVGLTVFSISGTALVMLF